MIWFSFARWSHAAGQRFVRDRIYWKGYRWTPLVSIRWRYRKRDSQQQPS